MRSEQAQRRFANIPFAEYLGIHLVSMEQHRIVLALPYQYENANPGGVLNGGATASLINMAGALVVWHEVDLAQPLFLGTTDLAIQYLAPVQGDDIMATAELLRRGRDMFFLDITVAGPEQRLVSKALMIYRAVDYTGRPRRLQAQAEFLAPPSPERACTPRLVGGPYTRKLQIEPIFQHPGRVCLRMPCWPRIGDEQGSIHEGALASLFDTAGTMAAWSMVRPQRSRGATVGMQMSFTGLPAREAVLAEARVQHRSEEVFFSTVQLITATTQQLIAMGNVSYRLLEAP